MCIVGTAKTASQVCRFLLSTRVRRCAGYCPLSFVPPIVKSADRTARPMMTRIRKAQEEDCQKIAEIMRDRSDIAFTDLDAITARLRENGFGEHPVFIAFLAEDDDAAGASRVIGYVTASRIYSTWEGKSLRLGDLYVVPDRRRKGVGTDLLRTVMKVCQEHGCKRIDCSPQMANTALISFLKKHGACNMAAEDGWCYYQLDHDNMVKLVGET